MKFLIYSPEYNETIGGVVVLHRLCHILNEIGYDAYLMPYGRRRHVFPIWDDGRSKAFKENIRSKFRGFAANPFFRTPVLKNIPSDIDTNNWVVIYPEIVLGNPVGAKNVVRWLLHQPGFHTGKFYYCPGELYFKFNAAIHDFNFPGSKTSDHLLKVIYYPLEHYNGDGASGVRRGSAYCIRKGKGKPMVHDTDGSILIDGKSHAEVAKIFKSVDRFYSYDTLTAYSLFAALCGCKSIVVPDNGVAIEQWYPDPEDRWGIAYGAGTLEIDRAQSTVHKVFDRIKIHHEESYENVRVMISILEEHFS
jgi:hypothetical protein